VAIILLVSAALMVIITFGGWSRLQGLKGVNLIWCAVYILLAFYIWTRWARGLLPIAAAFAILVLMLAVVAGTGLAGTSWFDRNSFGFASPKTIFGGPGLPTDALGFVTVLLIPVQILLIFFAMLGFSQGWNVEMEVPKDKAERGGQGGSSSSAEPATA
jgi:lysylphosphatidylglycerol synthetase-like protein (DUF2156 family)